MALLAEYIPEGHRAAGVGKTIELQLLDALGEFGIFLPRLADSGKVSFDIGGKHRNPDLAECLGHDLQRDRFACPCRTRDQSVAVRHLGKKVLRLLVLRDQQRFSHGRSPRKSVSGSSELKTPGE